MKFMVHWRTHPEKRMEVISGWIGRSPEERAELGSGLKMIGRWHDVVEGTGVLIVEADRAEDLAHYLTGWSFVMDLTAVPVLDDEESAAALKKGLAALG